MLKNKHKHSLKKKTNWLEIIEIIFSVELVSILGLSCILQCLGFYLPEAVFVINSATSDFFEGFYGYLKYHVCWKCLVWKRNERKASIYNRKNDG